MEVNENKKKMTDGMSTGQKISYYWYYYKWIYLLIAAAVIFAIVIGKTAYEKMNQDVVLHVVGANAGTYTDECEKYFDDFLTKYDYDDRAVVEKEFSISTNQESSAEGAMALQLLAALFAGGNVDIFISDAQLFDDECAKNAFINMEEFLPEDILERCSDRLYYAKDADGEEKPYGLLIAGTKLASGSLGLYSDEDKPVMGIGSQYSVEEMNVINMIEYLME